MAGGRHWYTKPGVSSTEASGAVKSGKIDKRGLFKNVISVI